MVRKDFSEEKTFKGRCGNDVRERDMGKSAEGTSSTKVIWGSSSLGDLVRSGNSLCVRSLGREGKRIRS